MNRLQLILVTPVYAKKIKEDQWGCYLEVAFRKHNQQICQELPNAEKKRGCIEVIKITKEWEQILKTQL